jgi:hypothetical protein
MIHPTGNEIFLPTTNLIRSRTSDVTSPDMYMTRGTVATDVACSCSVTSRKGYKTLLTAAQCYTTFYGRNLPLGAVVAKKKSVRK